MSTHRDRILEFLEKSPGRDDDEIAKALRIEPRQAVNLVCRQLSKEGLLSRTTGPRGKIINSLIHTQTATPKLEADEDGELAPNPKRPRLTSEQLVSAGFMLAAHWTLTEQRSLEADRLLPADRGVYAFTKDGVAQYVGVASMGLLRRLHFYAKPGSTQRTSLRLNGILREQLEKGAVIAIYVASPPDFQLRGLPVNASAGLEIGLIENFHLPWNVRGVR